MNSFIIKDSGEIIQLADLIQKNSLPLDEESAMDALMEAIGEARYVLLGEASHGTHEYYTLRTAISKRLITEKGFSFIAVEGDWPDCYRLNRFIKGYPDSGGSAMEVLHAFNRWPTWMWANWEIVALAEWLRNFNTGKPSNKKIGFYGLDVYSLWESLEAIIGYLDKADPAAKETALQAWKCFEPYNEEGGGYARSTLNPLAPASCENEVVELLGEILRKMENYNSDPEAVMSTEQNAFVAVNAERYYRTMIQSGPRSWNIRDRHMVETLNRLMDHHGPKAKAIVWEHNTHIGDARATDMRREGMVNVGQLVREDHPEKAVFTVGFGAYQGRVIAGRHWGDVMRDLHMPPARTGSWEHLMHQAGEKDLLLLMSPEIQMVLGNKTFGHRAIGVVYHPDREAGNYVPSIIPNRYDAFIFLNESKALHPLHIEPDGHQMPETYPFGE